MRKILLNHSNVLSNLLQCSDPSKPSRLKRYGAFCAVLCWNCAVERISRVFGGAATRRLPASQGGAHPFNEAEPEVTPPPSSAESVMVPDNNGDPVDLNPVPTYNEASVINSDGIVYDPFDRPPGEEVVEAIPRARSRSPSRP